MKASGERYALKVMEKRFIKKEDKVRFVMQEKQILSSVSHPNVVKLFYTFKVGVRWQGRHGQRSAAPRVRRTRITCTWPWSCAHVALCCT